MPRGITRPEFWPEVDAYIATRLLFLGSNRKADSWNGGCEGFSLCSNVSCANLPTSLGVYRHFGPGRSMRVVGGQHSPYFIGI
jgi:hypothetical protein